MDPKWQANMLIVFQSTVLQLTQQVIEINSTVLLQGPNKSLIG